MSVQHEHALLEVQLQLELDEQRGVPRLAPRARALQQAPAPLAISKRRGKR
jgi:hypothetical protein